MPKKSATTSVNQVPQRYEIKKTRSKKKRVSSKGLRSKKKLVTGTPSDKPKMSHGEHTLSPHVLTLKQSTPSPEVTLEKTSIETLSIDFLHRYEKMETSETQTFTNDNDLQLQPTEIERQLTREIVIPSQPPVPMEPVTHIISRDALANHPKIFEKFSSDPFAPKKAPEDIFRYFDFPDEDKSEKTQTWRRPVAIFVALSFAFVLPLQAMSVVQNMRMTKAQIQHSSEEAVALLSQAAQSALRLDAEQAKDEFDRAGDQFQSAKETIEQLSQGTDLLLSILPLTKEGYTTGEALLEAGKNLAIAGGRLADGYAAMESELSPTPLSRLNILKAYLTSTLPHIEAAQKALLKVSTQVIPEAYRDILASTQTSLPIFVETIHEFEEWHALAQTLLGGTGTKRYLIVFQNNTEIRPTGGFIGSFAEIKVRDGVIEHLNIPAGGSYDLQGSLRENMISPPPLQLLNARWEFQDANWFPDFPTSARQLIQFYQDAGGPSVDGVIAVNATFIAKLIGLIGPIEMETYGRELNEENFIFETQRIVEYEYDRTENDPKAFIGDLAPKLIDRTIQKTSEDFLSTIDFLSQGLAQKDIQLYLTDEGLERQIIEHGWGGEIKWTEGDYLMVVDTNLGGGKTDGVITEEMDLRVEIGDDGTIVNSLTISRTHLGIQGVLFTGVNNVDYLRVYVPKDSILLEASGFSPPDTSLFEQPEESWVIDDDLAYSLETQTVDPASGTFISEEHGKTVFGNWVQTKPGAASTVTLRYQLPFTIEELQGNGGIFASLASWAGSPQTDAYTLTLQKQPGVIDRTTRVRVDWPEFLQPLWTSEDVSRVEFENQTDNLFAILFESL